jgi:hypothetical protein
MEEEVDEDDGSARGVMTKPWMRYVTQLRTFLGFVVIQLGTWS